MNQSTGLKRTTIDKYYTAPNIVSLCMKIFLQNIKVNKNDLCIEPSAGNGAFIKSIKSYFQHYEFYDIEPENNEITKLNYLEYEHCQNVKFNKIHIIGNPPFGRQSSLAIKFIKKSTYYCDSISFIEVLKKKA